MTETTTKIDTERALTLMGEAVEQLGGDHRAPCKYHEEGRPVCLVGHALHKVGVDLSEVFGEHLNRSRIHELHRDGDLPDDLTITSRALKVLARAQDSQDAGMRWSDALREAKDEAEAQEGFASDD